MHWYEDMNSRWAAIGDIVREFGEEEDQNAWALCRGDAGEWRSKLEQYIEKYGPLPDDNRYGESTND